TIKIDGRSLLTGNHETTANAVISDLPIDRVLLVAGQRDLPVSGTLSATGQVSGTLQDPPVIANFTVVKGSAYNEPFDRLNANVDARSLTVNSLPLGDLTATAKTRGQEVVFDLTSDLAHSNIRGSGRMQLAGDYPLNAQMTFSNLTYAGLRPLVGGDQEPF